MWKPSRILWETHYVNLGAPVENIIRHNCAKKPPLPRPFPAPYGPPRRPSLQSARTLVITTTLTSSSTEERGAFPSLAKEGPGVVGQQT
jgi:hypothetical protein